MPTITGTPVTGATATLSTIRDRVEATLQDSGNATWSTDDVDEAIRKTLERFNWVMPCQTIGTVTLAAAGREVDVSSLTGIIDVKRVWWDYDSNDPNYPPDFKRFELWPGGLLYINDEEEPAAGDVVRVWYVKPHTIQNLDGASTTTLDANAVAAIVTGAAGYCAQTRAQELTEQATVDPGVVNKLNDWANKLIGEFRTYYRAEANTESTRKAGMLGMPPLDRFDAQDDGW